MPPAPFATPLPPDEALLARVRQRLARDGDEPSPARVSAALRSEGGILGGAAALSVAGGLRAEIAGAGPLDALVEEPGVTDVLVNRPDAVYVDRGGGLELTAVRFRDEPAVRRLAQRLAAAAGRRLDDASPHVDARLPGGIRLHAVLPPVAVGGTLISLRIASRRSLSLEDLIAADTVDEPMARVLLGLIRARRSLLVTGGTGSGKTTLLAALLGCVDDSERIVLVEDSAELVPDHPHVVGLEARRGNVEGIGAIDLRDLVRQALRMRPDRLVVGEVRGAEVVDLLAALNTGHAGGCGTVHANAAADLPARIEALGLAAGMSPAAVNTQLVTGVDAVVHLTRGRDGRRRVREVHVLRRSPDGVVRTHPVIRREGDRQSVSDMDEVDLLIGGDGETGSRSMRLPGSVAPLASLGLPASAGDSPGLPSLPGSPGLSTAPGESR